MRPGLCTLAAIILLAAFNAPMQTPDKLADAWEADHVSRMPPSDVRHADLKKSLDQLKKAGIKVDQVGLSFANREIYQIEWGHGPLKILMWSQMHGDEPTATSALIDMFAYFQKHRGDKNIRQLESTVTIRAVPMLNPDGAELYQRRNQQDIDINRDALDLRSPEARLLKQLRDDWNPAIGFNLHNQQYLTTVGHSPIQATISLLVVYGDAEKTTTPGQERNTRIASAIVTALQRFIPGHISRYPDEYTPTAFGDNFSAWGTPTILIETGGLYGKDEMYLVKLNFVAFMTALESIATGGERDQSPQPYLDLIENSSGALVNYVFRRANIVSVTPQAATDPSTFAMADLGCVTERRRASFAAPTYIRMMGPLGGLRGLEEYDASGFNVVQRFGTTRTGELAELLFYKRERVIDWSAPDLEKNSPPDAIFSAGKWFKGAGIVPKR
ncbi:MAG TPA: M14 family zinc carboxypeptidase [Pyrinomonadaceae bacterium]|nr:M14 family zinc carboxypeptidase [Pyrinomonadaceae bacterium]